MAGVRRSDLSGGLAVLAILLSLLYVYLKI